MEEVFLAANAEDDVPLTCTAKGDPAPRLVWQSTAGLSWIHVLSNNVTNEIRLVIKGGGEVWSGRRSHVLYCEAHQDRIGVTTQKAFHLKRECLIISSAKPRQSPYFVDIYFQNPPSPTRQSPEAPPLPSSSSA